MSIASKSQTIYTGCADIRAAIREEDSTKGGGLITTLGDQIRALFARRFVVLWRKTDITEDDGEGNQVVTGTTYTQEKINYTGSTSIPGLRFQNDTSLISVILPETITNIGNNNDYYDQRGSFQGCTNLEYINLENVQLIARGAFEGTALRSLNLASLTTATRNCFRNCTKLREVKISGPITNLANADSSTDTGMFYNCSDLKSISLGNVTALGRSTFKNCSSLETVTGIENLRTINAEAFKNCAKLGGFTLTEARTIGYEAFQGLHGAEYYLGNNVTSIGYSAFYNYTGDWPTTADENPLSGAVNLPNLTSLDGASFINTRITEIQNLGTITTLPARNMQPGTMGPFACCKYLESAHLPSTLTYIGVRSFFDCNSLTSVIVDGTQDFTVSTAAFYKCSSLTFEGFPWNRIGPSLGANAFQYCTGLVYDGVLDLSKVTSGLSDTGSHFAFADCPGMTGDLILDGITTTLGVDCFSGNFYFRSYSFMGIQGYLASPSSNRPTFTSSGNLKKVTIGPGCTGIGGRAFQGNTSIKTVVLYAETPPVITTSSFYCLANGVQRTGGPADRKYYVPYSSDHSILNAYQTATNWSSFASQIYELTPDGEIPV